MKRDIFDRLIAWKGKKGRKPLILRGARQVGKTYILKSLGERFANCHYLNFEKEERLGKIFEQDFDPRRILNELRFALNRPITVKEDLVIFDEIQESPRALTSLKYF